MMTYRYMHAYGLTLMDYDSSKSWYKSFNLHLKINWPIWQRTIWTTWFIMRIRGYNRWYYFQSWSIFWSCAYKIQSKWMTSKQLHLCCTAWPIYMVMKMCIRKKHWNRFIFILVVFSMKSCCRVILFIIIW